MRQYHYDLRAGYFSWWVGRGEQHSELPTVTLLAIVIGEADNLVIPLHGRGYDVFIVGALLDTSASARQLLLLVMALRSTLLPLEALSTS